MSEKSSVKPEAEKCVPSVVLTFPYATHLRTHTSYCKTIPTLLLCWVSLRYFWFYRSVLPWKSPLSQTKSPCLFSATRIEITPRLSCPAAFSQTVCGLLTLYELGCDKVTSASLCLRSHCNLYFSFKKIAEVQARQSHWNNPSTHLKHKCHCVPPAHWNQTREEQRIRRAIWNGARGPSLTPWDVIKPSHCYFTQHKRVQNREGSDAVQRQI